MSDETTALHKQIHRATIGLVDQIEALEKENRELRNFRVNITQAHSIIAQEAVQAYANFEPDGINYKGMRPYQLGIQVGLNRAVELMKPVVIK